MQLKDQSFNDIFYHAKALDFWEQEYNQLSELAFDSRLQDLSFKGVRIFREQMNCRVAQCTRTPPNTVNVLLPIQLMPEKDHVPTHTLYAHGATLLPSESEFFFCTPPNTDYIVISLDQQVLEQKLLQQDLDKILKKRFGCGILINTKISQVLIQKCVDVLATMQTKGDVLNESIQKRLCDEITDLILHYFVESDEVETLKDLGSNHHHIVQHVYQRVLESDNPITILDLCQELQIPHRSLHYAFEKTTGMSPNKYIRAIRLNAADRIIHKNPDMPKLTDLAHQYGFSHSSHFGREYKKLFGRIPSQTSKEGDLFGNIKCC